MPYLRNMSKKDFLAKYGDAIDSVRLLANRAVFSCRLFSEHRTEIITDKLDATQKIRAMQLVLMLHETNEKLKFGKTEKFIIYSASDGERNYSSALPDDRAIYCSTDAAFSWHAVPVVLHEQSHIYYQFTDPLFAKPVMDAYLAIMKIADFQPYPDQYILSYCHQNYFLSLFNEETYGGVSNHSFSNETELFTNMTVILRQFSKCFWKELETRQMLWKDEKEAALHVASAVVRLWGKARMFSEEVYLRLGLKDPKTEKDRQTEQLWRQWVRNEFSQPELKTNI